MHGSYHMYKAGNKLCRTCKTLKDYRSYYKANANSDGYENQCKVCKSGSRDPETRRIYIKAWRAKKKAEGHYGLCSNCKTPLGRNEGIKSLRARGVCKECNFGTNHVSWNGGKTLNHDGYVVYRYAKGKTKLEHRYLMEQHLGRELFEDENIHHINGVKTDNRIENLELWSSMQPRGQRIADKITWAKAILARYDKDTNV